MIGVDVIEGMTKNLIAAWECPFGLGAPSEDNLSQILKFS